MKEQYVGDVSDYRKYALLRLLEKSGLKLGVCWMLTPNDGRSDGNKRAYLDQPGNFERYDPDLFALLRRVKDQPDARRLVLIEESGILPGAVFVNTLVPDRLFERQVWFRKASKDLADCNLIFFDPDNGIEVASKAMGRRNSSKYVYRDELAVTYRSGHSLLIYQHYPRKEREAFIRDIASVLQSIAPDAAIWAIRTKYLVFMLVIQPHHSQALSGAADHLRDATDPTFLNAQLVLAPSP